MDLIDRLFGLLLEALEREGTPSDALTVGDVYQRLVPYRTIRHEVGVLELAQYEDALLRLLAGERGHLALSDSEAATELRRELASPNPILGIYRDYAESTVEIHGRGAAAAASFGAALDTTEEAPQPLHASREPRSIPRQITRQPEAPEPAGANPASSSGDTRRFGRAADLASPTASCRRCGSPLPPEEDLRFCPTCGGDQQAVPCSRCEAPLREEWNFCVRCGTRRVDREQAS